MDAICDIVRVDIKEEKASGKTYTLLEQSSNATITPIVSQGKDEELRVGNTIHAQNITENITKGYQLQLENVLSNLEVLALIDGGTYDAESKTYTDPVAGQQVKRELITVVVYTKVKDYSGETVSYRSYELKHGKGSPVAHNIQDGTFTAESLSISARPAKGESCLTIKGMDQLPA